MGFNFYQFLEDNGYERETIRKPNGETFCNNYQKEIAPQSWNCISVHENKTISAANDKHGLFLKEQPQPETLEDAEFLLKKAECKE